MYCLPFKKDIVRVNSSYEKTLREQIPCWFLYTLIFKKWGKNSCIPFLYSKVQGRMRKKFHLYLWFASNWTYIFILIYSGKTFFTNTKLISLYESVCFTFSCWQIDRKCIGFQPERKDSCHGGKIWGLRKDSRIYRSGKNQLRASDYPEDGRNSPSW